MKILKAPCRQECDISENWLKERQIIVDIDDFIEDRIREILRARPDWKRNSPHVVKVRKEYRQFMRQYQKEDHLWFFQSSPISWQYLAGRAGYVILRRRGNDMRIVAMLVTRLS
jgi:hypothetical protein